VTAWWQLLTPVLTAVAVAVVVRRGLALVGRVAHRRGRRAPGASRPARRRRDGALATIARRVAGTRLAELVALVGPSDERLLRIARVAAVDAGLRELRGAQLLCAAAMAVAALRAARSPAPAGLVIALAAAWGGAMFPAWWLGRVGARRMRALRSVLPDGLELTRACVTGGLPLRRALAATAAHCREPLAGELRWLGAQASVGVPLVVAVDELAARNPLPEVRALAVAVKQAERHGAPLAGLLAAIADDARQARERAIADRAAAAAPQIQLVVAGLLVPAALLQFAALLIAALARGELTLL
jgi:tight adherence protein C